jgi:hypothetical protein
MGTRLDRARLAVAVSKRDLLAEQPGLLPDRPDDGDTARAWLCERLGLRNLVKAMDLEFGEVRFFWHGRGSGSGGASGPEHRGFRRVVSARLRVSRTTGGHDIRVGGVGVP